MSNFAKVYERTNADQLKRIYFGLTMDEIKSKVALKVRSEIGYSYNTIVLNTNMHRYKCFSDFKIEDIEEGYKKLTYTAHNLYITPKSYCEVKGLFGNRKHYSVSEWECDWIENTVSEIVGDVKFLETEGRTVEVIG